MSERNETPDEALLTSEILGGSTIERRDPSRVKQRAAVVFGLGAAALAGMVIATGVTGTDHPGQTGHVSLQSYPNTTCCIRSSVDM